MQSPLCTFQLATSRDKWRLITNDVWSTASGGRDECPALKLNDFLVSSQNQQTGRHFLRVQLLNPNKDSSSPFVLPRVVSSRVPSDFNGQLWRRGGGTPRNLYQMSPLVEGFHQAGLCSSVKRPLNIRGPNTSQYYPLGSCACAPFLFFEPVKERQAATERRP